MKYIIISYLTISLVVFLICCYYYFKCLFRRTHKFSNKVPASFFLKNTLETKTFTGRHCFDFSTRTEVDYYYRSGKGFFKMNLLVSLLWLVFIFILMCRKLYKRLLYPLLVYLWCNKEERLILKEKRVQKALGTDNRL